MQREQAGSDIRLRPCLPSATCRSTPRPDHYPSVTLGSPCRTCARRWARSCPAHRHCSGEPHPQPPHGRGLGGAGAGCTAVCRSYCCLLYRLTPSPHRRRYCPSAAGSRGQLCSPHWHLLLLGVVAVAVLHPVLAAAPAAAVREWGAGQRPWGPPLGVVAGRQTPSAS